MLMFSASGLYVIYFGRYFGAIFAAATIALLVGLHGDVEAGVFKQSNTGKIIVLGGDASLGASPQIFEFSNDNPTAASRVGSAASSVIDISPPNVPTRKGKSIDGIPMLFTGVLPPVGTLSDRTKFKKALQKLSLPEPRRLQTRLSAKQHRMRMLATEVGYRFAGKPGVRKAKMDKDTFVRLFTSMIQRESNFKPSAVSPVGARGLGQLMPATARSLGVVDSFSPRENLIGAATYITDMLYQFGAPELALAAYNAGPGNVSKYGGIPPYRETRQYVADIFHEVIRVPGKKEKAAALAVVRAQTNSGEPQAPKKPIVERTSKAHKVLPPFALSGLRTTTPHLEAEPRVHVVSVKATVETVHAETENIAISSMLSLGPGSKSAVANPFATLVNDRPDGQQDLWKPNLRGLEALPEPQPLMLNLTKAQIAMRDLAANVALRYADAPEVRKAGFSAESFASYFVAMIGRQSSFDPRAVSWDGAKGLGQLRSTVITELDVQNPFSAEENLEASVKYLVKMLGRYEAPVLALAAYNAGPNEIVENKRFSNRRYTHQLVANVLNDLESGPVLAPRPFSLTALSKSGPHEGINSEYLKASVLTNACRTIPDPDFHHHAGYRPDERDGVATPVKPLLVEAADAKPEMVAVEAASRDLVARSAVMQSGNAAGARAAVPPSDMPGGKRSAGEDVTAFFVSSAEMNTPVVQMRRKGTAETSRLVMTERISGSSYGHGSIIPHRKAVREVWVAPKSRKDAFSAQAEVVMVKTDAVAEKGDYLNGKKKAGPKFTQAPLEVYHGGHKRKVQNVNIPKSNKGHIFEVFFSSKRRALVY